MFSERAHIRWPTEFLISNANFRRARSPQRRRSAWINENAKELNKLTAEPEEEFAFIFERVEVVLHISLISCGARVDRSAADKN